MKKSFMLITPNPSEESYSFSYNVHVNKIGYSISIYDPLGKTKKELYLTRNQGSSALFNKDIGVSGVYFIFFRECSGVIFSKILIL